ncbi:hypothetical protein F511_03863 [Dorcoceras hygrometricum]|nr:hypothetical protein F511_03863 [Dorcoceras hygrometricum]
MIQQGTDPLPVRLELPTAKALSAGCSSHTVYSHSSPNLFLHSSTPEFCFENTLPCYFQQQWEDDKSESSQSSTSSVSAEILFEEVQPARPDLSFEESSRAPLFSHTATQIKNLSSVFKIYVTNTLHRSTNNRALSGFDKDARASGNTALSSPCWDMLSLMRRVVNYHRSWVGQRQVELFDASVALRSGIGPHVPLGLGLFVACVCFQVFQVFRAGRCFNPAGGAPGGR